MSIHSVKSFEGVEFRLLLILLGFMLPLIAYVGNHVSSGCFVSLNVPEHRHCANVHPGGGTDNPGPNAELQEEEFDEAVIPKAFHDFIPVFELPQPFRFERIGCPRSAGSALCPHGRIRIPLPKFQVLRC